MNPFRKTKWRFNVYGYWQYVDRIPLEGGIQHCDIVYVFSKQGEMVSAYTSSGRVTDFHVSNLEKEYFVRPDRGHPPAECPVKGMFGSDCWKCSVHNAKRKLKKVLLRKKKNPRR